jgi:hypothetical protein
MTVHNALVATGLRDRIKVGASGKVAAGNDIVKRLIQGADYTNAARATMTAVGCIQAQRCHTNQCPVGVVTQDPRRARALHLADKSVRAQRYQESTVRQAVQLMASPGVRDPGDRIPHMLRKKISPNHAVVLCRTVRMARPRATPRRAAREMGPRLTGHLPGGRALRRGCRPIGVTR